MIYLVNTNLLCHRRDSHSSGIPYLPYALAYLSAALDRAGMVHRVIDAFGEAPGRGVRRGDKLFLGLSPEEISERITEPPTAFVISGNAISSSAAYFLVAQTLRDRFPAALRVGIENSHAVTGFSLLKSTRYFTDDSFSHLVFGESEAVLPEALPDLVAGRPVAPAPARSLWRPGESTSGKAAALVEDLDALPWPNWDRFPLRRYWDYRCAHAPVARRYLPILTSRGCPYKCAFCSIPTMSGGTWRRRDFRGVVDEMEFFSRKFSVQEFHWEDVNPTVHEPRVRQIAQEILDRNLRIEWKLPAGTKLDALSISTLELMARAGMSYVSFSPESGSPDVLKKINKPFRHEYALEQVRRLKELNVESQACFVLGFPGENRVDARRTREFSKRLVRAGVGEVTYFIVSPMPGTPIESKIPGEVSKLDQLTFSASWRVDHRQLRRRRRALYLSFFWNKLRYRPWAFGRSCLRALFGGVRLKMEMFPKRFLRTQWLFFASPRCARG